VISVGQRHENLAIPWSRGGKFHRHSTGNLVKRVADQKAENARKGSRRPQKGGMGLDAVVKRKTPSLRVPERHPQSAEGVGSSTGRPWKGSKNYGKKRDSGETDTGRRQGVAISNTREGKSPTGSRNKLGKTRNRRIKYGRCVDQKRE